MSQCDVNRHKSEQALRSRRAEIQAKGILRGTELARPPGWSHLRVGDEFTTHGNLCEGLEILPDAQGEQHRR